MKNLVYIIIIILFFGCNNAIEKPKRPDNLIPEDKMVEIMYDVFLLNSAKGINKIKLEENGVLPEKYIFEKYQIDSLQFANSNNYYAYDTKTYESILKRIKDKIEVYRKEYEALTLVEEAAKEKKADSLRVIRVKVKDSLIKLGKKKPILKVD
jgi:hypothetical protein